MTRSPCDCGVARASTEIGARLLRSTTPQHQITTTPTPDGASVLVRRDDNTTPFENAEEHDAFVHRAVVREVLKLLDKEN